MLTNILLALLGWFVLSVVVALGIGRALHRLGGPDDDE